MISIREQDYGLNVALYNEFTLDDFHQFEDVVFHFDLLCRFNPPDGRGYLLPGFLTS